MSKSRIVPPKRVENLLTSKCVIGPIPLRPSLIALHAPFSAAHGQCWPRGAVERILILKYGESRQGAVLPGSVRPFEFYANAATGSWTILQAHMRARFCIVGAGANKPPRRGDRNEF